MSTNVKLSFFASLILLSQALSLSLSVVSLKADDAVFVCPNGNSKTKRKKKSKAPSKILLLNSEGSKLKKERRLAPLGRKFKKALRCAKSDMNADGVDDIIVASGPGTPSILTIIDGNSKESFSPPFERLAPFGPDFRGGVYVATGDLNFDSVPDVIVGAGDTAPQVNVFDGVSGEQLLFFNAYDAGFAGGVRVASADINGDGFDDIITAPGDGSQRPNVKVFSGRDGSELHSFFAFDDSFKGGVYVAAADINGDGLADVVTGAGSGGSPRVRVFDGKNLNLLTDFFAYGQRFKGGVTVSTGDVNGDGNADIITGPARKGRSRVRVFDGTNGEVIDSFFAFPKSFKGGAFIAVSRPDIDPIIDPTPDLEPTPEAASFVDILPFVGVSQFAVTTLSDACELSDNGSLASTIGSTGLTFTDLFDNENVLFNKTDQGSYTASGVTIYNIPNHPGSLNANGCILSFAFFDSMNNQICESTFAFNPNGHPAETLILAQQFSNCSG